MFNKINHIFDFNQNALNLYAKRQEILASNIANADTPGYKSIDIDFQNELKKTLQKKNMNHTNIILKKTSPNHLNAKNNTMFALNIEPVITSQIKLDGNTVDMNRERINFINNSLRYESSLVFINNEIKNIMYVLQG